MSTGNEFRPQQVDPYRDLVPSSGPTPSGTMGSSTIGPSTFQKVPSGLTAVGILFTVFGVLGVIVFFAGILGMIVSAVIDPATMQGSMPEGPMKQFQEEMSAMGRQSIWFYIPWTLLNGLVSGLLLLSGIGLLKRKLWAARLGSKTCRIGIVTELLRLAHSGFMCYQQYQVYSKLNSTLNGSEEGVFLILGIMVVSLVFGVGYVIFKIGLYLWCGNYLRSDKATPYLTA